MPMPEPCAGAHALLAVAPVALLTRSATSNVGASGMSWCGSAGESSTSVLAPTPAASRSLAPRGDAGAVVGDWLAKLGQDMPLAPTFEMVGPTSSAASGSASSTCAHAPRGHACVHGRAAAAVSRYAGAALRPVASAAGGLFNFGRRLLTGGRLGGARAPQPCDAGGRCPRGGPRRAAPAGALSASHQNMWACAMLAYLWHCIQVKYRVVWLHYWYIGLYMPRVNMLCCTHMVSCTL